MDDIANDIYRYQNCAIWYDSKPLDDFDEDDYLNQLKERMQLFVVPITTHFLLEDNRARDLELGFALRNNIPVLPLMLESGLEVPFKEHCGDLQFLDKTSHDITAISYDEKLKKYLASVLIGDELAAKIRDAFDAHMFLSYRKKDRKYAHELMRHIHKNHFARDIAIWYDEYLIPGEGFNNAIEQALKSSKLFAMVVTPNLVNETNYVMEKEYPMAKGEGKPIIPVEMKSTDRAALEEIDHDFPPCVDAKNESALSKVLLEKICEKKINYRQNDKDPEHNFLIGLAYLNGVDMEIDHERAAELITSAADAGVIDAIDKLVEMYRSGQGVERDYEIAIAWQERKIVLLEDLYHKDSSTDNLSQLFRTITECGTYYNSIGELSLAIKKHEVANHYAETFALTNENNSITVKLLSEGYFKLGECFFLNDSHDKAQVYLQKALAYAEQFAIMADTVEDRFQLATRYTRLSRIISTRNPSDAKIYILKAIHTIEDLANEVSNMTAQLSICYGRLSSILIREGNVSEARKYREQSLALAKQLVYGNTEQTISNAPTWNVYYLATCYVDFALFLQEEGEENYFIRAKIYYEEGIKLLELVAKQTELPLYRCKMALALFLLSTLDDKSGKDHIIRGYDIITELCQECPTFTPYHKIKEVIERALSESDESMNLE